MTDDKATAQTEEARKVTRYDYAGNESESGDLVFYGDYVELERELERLSAEIEQAYISLAFEGIRPESLSAGIEQLRAENARLKATAPIAEGARQLAEAFHETYERLAPHFGYETRVDTKRFDPESSNGRLMMAVCGEVVGRAIAAALSEGATPDMENWDVIAQRQQIYIADLEGRLEDKEVATVTCEARAYEKAWRAVDEMVDWPLEKHPATTITEPEDKARIYLIGIQRGLVNATNAIRALSQAPVEHRKRKARDNFGIQSCPVCGKPDPGHDPGCPVATEYAPSPVDTVCVPKSLTMSKAVAEIVNGVATRSGKMTAYERNVILGFAILHAAHATVAAEAQVATAPVDQEERS